jgi:heme exporter protein A
VDVPALSAETDPARAAPLAPPFLELDHVSKAFGRRLALRDVSLSIPEGECLALLGPNGAGKTTLLRIAAGVAKPTSGNLLFQGSSRDVWSRLRPDIGFVGHETLLYDALSPRQNLTFFARLYRVPNPPARVRDLLKLIGLERHADRQVADFSRGMQQRVAVARALVHSPKLLILDEPMAGLDADGVRLLAQMLQRLKAERATMLLATHFLEETLDLADAFAVLGEGELRRHARRQDLPAGGLRALYDEAAAR